MKKLYTLNHIDYDKNYEKQLFIVINNQISLNSFLETQPNAQPNPHTSPA